MAYVYPDLRTTLFQWFDLVGPVIRAFHMKRGAGKITKENEHYEWALTEECFRSPEWVGVIMATKTYPDLRSQLDRGVKTALSHDTLQERFLGQAFIASADGRFRESKPLPISTDAQWFDSVYAPIEEYFTSLALPFVITLPFQGLECEATQVELDPQSEFIRLDDATIKSLKNRNLNFAEPDAFGSVPENLRYALRHRFLVPKLGDSKPSELIEYQELFESIRRAAIRTITATMPNRVVSNGLYLDREGWQSSYASSAFQPSLIFRKIESRETILSSSDENLLRVAWSRFSNRNYIRQNSDIALASDRLTKADSETDPADRLVDTMTAAEALLSRDGSLADELPYRISLRAARFAENATNLRQAQIFNLVRTGFAIRNKILRSIKINVADLAGEGDTLGIVVDRIERVTRIILQRMISEESRTPNSWKALMLKGPPS